ncbi:pyrophosphohydrolase domain-containing protein [Craterilacuibacter sinensis]|uniref:Phosphoribosyl-ATP pyrophosphohydrolase n=1 Tax=Craterilacuibacter sinensis TaxID=2686017 RepID=A0A845BH09_9NEIS|nr:nucleoside triphosphate pyrophosphohydrolase family protein [Craterilacuibacter sinensis]MXR35585.1 phosphoribosyl-ATP pyrophosphohydrolase [Craterilacuibacter sinensis]
MSDFFAARRDFMQRFDFPIPDTPEYLPQRLALWDTMLTEEWQEFSQALADYKAVDTGDSAALQRARAELAAEGVDVLNVLAGLLLSQGLPLEAMFNAIHAANLAKSTDGKVLRRSDGKLLKPPGWQPADKEAIIRQACEKS